jgi:hypothetical protein
MKKLKVIALVGVLLLSLLVAGVASAQDEPPEDPPPTDSYSHPIVQLLATYFGQTESTNPDQGEGQDPEQDQDQDADQEGDTDPESDPQAALEAEIAGYFEEGLGFGELVKVYAIAAESEEACAEEGGTQDPETPCGVTVEELVEMVEGGTGMGQLFQMYGRPSMLGVGHVRQQLNNGGQGAPLAQPQAAEQGSGSNDQQGICNARSHGGNANANGQNVNCD